MPNRVGLEEGIEEDLTRRIDEAIRMAGEPQPVPVNMYEADEALVLVAPMPGVMADDIEVLVEPRMARIRAGMRTAAPKRYLLHEWHYGPYERSIEIPDGFGAEAQAAFGNGQLAVRLLRGRPPDGTRVVVRPQAATA
jgi:HSP20 family protein